MIPPQAEDARLSMRGRQGSAVTVLRYVVYLVIVVAVRVHAPAVAHRPMASMKRVFSPMRPSITSTRADETSSPHSPPRQMKRTDDGGYGGEEDEEIMD